MVDMMEGYWYARPSVTLRYSPQLETWWVEVIDGNDKEYVGEWIEGIDNYKYENNGFLYKSMWGANFDDKEEALQAVEILSRVFKEINKKEYLILGKIDENHTLATTTKKEVN